jgi:hypothetical protein
MSFRTAAAAELLTPTKSQIRGNPEMKIQVMESLTVKSHVMASTTVGISTT